MAASPPPPDSDPATLAETAVADGQASDSIAESTRDSALRGLLREVLGLPDRELAAGRVLDDTYRIEAVLGAGGMGRVYRARDLRLGRDVAIKVHAGRARDPGGARLQREAEALARLNHPHVVTVYEVGAVDGHAYVAMEYVPGGTARTWLTAAVRSPRAIVELYIAAGRGLAAAHAVGLVHRDFKPDNLLVGDDGRIRVADFGLARSAGPAPGAPPPGDDEVPGLTRTGAVMGTPAYMAPEQRAGAAVGPSADQFAFAVALWEALGGRRPYTGTTEREVADAVNAGAITPLPAGRVPRHVERALRRALARDPAARWPSMDALLAALTHETRGRRRRNAIAIGLAGVVAGGLVLASTRSAGRAARPPCERAAAQLDATWNPVRAARVRAALAAARPDDDHRSAITTIDRWAGRWRAQRVEVCEAVAQGGSQTPTLLDLRVHCLERARAGLDATAALLDPPTADLAGRARELAHALPDLGACADVPGLLGAPAPPTDPASRAAYAAIEQELARSAVLLRAGKKAENLALARDLVARADATGIDSAAAAARLALGQALVADGTHDGVLPLLEEGARRAASARDDVLAADIWLSVLDLLGSRLEDPGEADRILVVADAAIVRAGSPARQAARLDVTRGDLRNKAGDFAGAREALTRALAAQEQLLGPDHPDLALTLSRLSYSLRQLDDMAGSRVQLERAARLLEGTYGPSHPHLAAVLTNLGTNLQLQGDLTGSRATLERALAIKESLVGPDHLDLASPLVNLSNTLIAMHDLEPAQRHVERGLAILEKHLPPAHPKIGLAIAVLADVQTGRGDWAGAERSLDRSLEFGDRALRGELLTGRGLVRLRQRNLPGARADLEEALTLARDQRGPTSFSAGEIAVVLAQVTIAEGRRGRGLADYEAGLALMTASRGADHPAVVEARALLAALRAP